MIKQLKKKVFSVALQSIDFYHEEADCTNSSLSLLPSTLSWVPEHFSYAAYSIADAKEAVEKDQLKVWARFYKKTPKGSVQIRAVNTTPNLPDELSRKAFERFAGKDALGEIEPTRVFFGSSGQSVFRGKRSNVPFKVSGSKFPELGVGIYDNIWRWDYRTLSSKSTDDEAVWNKTWIPFDVSQHRIFITLDRPKSPWSTSSFKELRGTSSPDSPIWTEALYIACLWASGSKTIEEAGKKIADELFNCGKFVYHPDSHYSKDTDNQETTFFLSKVIERIQGGNGLGEKVNCVDCSLIVSTLTNVLGGNLRIGKLQHTSDTNYSDPEIVKKNRFEINTIRAIGIKDTATTMASLESEGKHYFSFHSIAWQPADNESPNFDDPKNIIYDACVQVITGEENAETEVETASRIPMGEDDNPSGYRSQLAAPTKQGIASCIAQDSTVRKILVQ
ncbi:MAG: hypothetical protein QNK23_04155 [Crocinitomicaceae bacterium]|nr:hypothetical protein [Crocinitomicaceae bacterium]